MAYKLLEKLACMPCCACLLYFSHVLIEALSQFVRVVTHCKLSIKLWQFVDLGLLHVLEHSSESWPWNVFAVDLLV